MIKAPWNNPLVATSFQIRNRRGGLFMSLTLYTMLLAMGSIAWLYYVKVYLPTQTGKVLPFDPLMAYFITLYAIQLGLSLLIASTRTAASIKAEVVNKTLDFQRIAALSPWDIMLGKLFGEAALAFLLIMATLPFAFICLVMGMPGLSLTTLFLLYLNLFTTTLMFGSFGLQNTLIIPAGKATGGGVQGFGLLIGISIAMALQLAWVGAAAPGGSWLNKPWSVVLIGLLSPVPSLFGLAQGNPWIAGLAWFEWHLPFLIITPLAQLLFTYLCMYSMSRRLDNLAQPVLDKPSCYGFLLAMDLLAIGVIDSFKMTNLTLAPRVAIFSCLHCLFTLIIMIAATPSREMLATWVWRYRHKRPYLMAEWLGDRSMNTLLLITSCLVFLAFAWLMTTLSKDPADHIQEIHLGAQQTIQRTAAEVVPAALTITCLVILSMGAVYQMILIFTNKYGRGLFFFVAMMAVAPPAMLGIYLHSRVFQNVQPQMADNIGFALSPIIHLFSWLGIPIAVPKTWPLAIVLGVATGLALWTNYRMLKRMCCKVDLILYEEMQVPRTQATNAAPCPQPTSMA